MVEMKIEVGSKWKYNDTDAKFFTLYCKVLELKSNGYIKVAYYSDEKKYDSTSHWKEDEFRRRWTHITVVLVTDDVDDWLK